MNANRMLLIVASVSLSILAAGCASDRFNRSKYLPDGEVISGQAEDATVYDLDTAVQNLMARMRAHPAFIRDYEDLLKKRGKKPVLQVLSLDCDRVSPRLDETRLRIVQDKVSQSAFESDLFALRDAKLADVLKTCDAPDCILRGVLTQVEERVRGRCYVYRLQLVLADASTSAVIWQGANTVLKVDRIAY